MFARKAIAAGMLFLFAVIVAGGTGCASQGEKMVASYTSTRETLTDSQQQVDATIASLAGLRRTPPQALSDGFSRYKDQVTKLEHDAQQMKWRAEEMQTEQEQHIKAWQKEMESINDPTIKSSLESRRQAARSNFALVRMYADDVKKAYEPFVQRNKEMVKALSIDLSPAAINSLSAAIDQVLSDGANLKQKLAAMQHAMDNIANGVSPIGH
jgi:hypothetical protein